jgi:hypothetical protein
MLICCERKTLLNGWLILTDRSGEQARNMVGALGMDLDSASPFREEKAFAFKMALKPLDPNYDFSPNELCFLVH